MGSIIIIFHLSKLWKAKFFKLCDVIVLVRLLGSERVNRELTFPTGFPVSWSIILFSFVCHPYLPAIEESMAQPEQFNSVMNYSFLISAATKIIYGFIAVLTFKQDTQQEISENLPAGALENTANALLGLNGLLSYALPSFTLFTIIQKANVPFMPPCFSNEEYQLSRRERVVVNVLRMLFVAFTVGVAVLLPQFSLIIALVGSITAVCFTLVFPCLFDVVLHSDNITTRRYVINVLIIFVGVLSSGFGFVFSIIAIIRVYL